MKSQRQAKIMEIISTTNVETQEQLLQALEEAGFRSTQATISRDIKELRIVKELTSLGTYRYTTSAKELPSTFSTRLNTIFRECVTKYDYAQNIVVIHTLPGLAGAAASAIDAMNMSVVMGSLAGDDTVIVIMRDNNAAAQFCGEISSLTCDCFCNYFCKHQVAVMLQLRDILDTVIKDYREMYNQSGYFAAICRNELLNTAMAFRKRGKFYIE